MKNKKIIIALISLSLFILIAIKLILDNLSSFDNYIYNLIINLESTKGDTFFGTITNLGNYLFIAVLTIIISIIFFIRKSKESFLVLINSFNVVVLSQVLKIIFARERPTVALIESTSYSFPSAHAMIAFGFYGFLIYLINRNNIAKKIKIITTICLSIIILLVGISRIYLGYHFASDVLASFFFTCAYLMLFILIFEKKLFNKNL